MEYIITSDIEIAKIYLIDFCLNFEVYKELNEYIFHNKNRKYIFAINDKICEGFVAFDFIKNTCTLKYCYINKYKRGNGIFSKMHNMFLKECVNSNINLIKVVSSNYAIPIYEKLGYKLVKKYKICSHFKKELL